jgi:periplasmic protein TonB
MLDYAVTQNQKHGLSGRTIICLTASFLVHFLFFIILIEFPQLFEAGYYHQFRGIQRNFEEDEDRNWRTVTILENPKRMEMPSTAMLKKLLAQEKNGSGAPPIRINLGNLAAALAQLHPLPKSPQKESKLPLPVNEKAPAPSDIKPAAQVAYSSNDQKNPADKETEIAITAQKSEPKTEIAATTTPSKIPDTIKPQPPAPTTDTLKAPVSNQKVSQNSGIGLSDTKGFPMGDYKDRIVERVYAQWQIPSNLNDYKLKTIVVFRIDKEGRCINIKIASSSGYRSLDDAALSAVKNSDPFPPLPKGFPGEDIGVKFTLQPVP